MEGVETRSILKTLERSHVRDQKERDRLFKIEEIGSVGETTPMVSVDKQCWSRNIYLVSSASELGSFPSDYRTHLQSRVEL